MGNGPRLWITRRRPLTQNKKRKSRYEKSKHSVQTNSRDADPGAARLLCGSVHLDSHPGSSRRDGALQWHCLGVRRLSVRHRMRAFNTRNQLRTREPIGSFHRDRGNFSATLMRIFVKIMFPTLAALTGLRPTVTKSTGLSRGTCAPQKHWEYSITMK